ncbi:hypothetical protein ABZP36_008261 [Zizania latifolia]
MEEPPPSPPHPPPSLAAALAHLRSLLSAASSALSSLPSPLHPHPITAPLAATLPSPLPTSPLPSLPPSSTSTVHIPLPSAPCPYSDCPGVVRATAPSPPAVSSLPAFLAAECADYSSADAAAVSVPSSPPRVLPSELCLLRREVDSWNAHGVPGSYSHAAARVAAALRSGFPRWEAEMRRWVVASSPRYGVVIDAVTRDHVWVLVRLCLKAAASEACCSLERAWNGEGGGSGFDPRSMRFECPRLVGGVSWLCVQLGILYGESNGRFFAIVAVKEAMLRAVSCLAVGVGHGVDVSGGGEARASGGSGVEGSDFGDVETFSVSVPQVASAIAALHERFLLEEKTKALRAPHSSKYQRLLEYSQALERGREERSKRPNYRAILEYDGVISRRVDSQESGRIKTKEELLAEERDYKRRRMSYRGKKVKRNPKEILRDIIDEHMEEIKQAGGIGCLVDAPGDIAHNMLRNNPHRGTYQDSFDPTSSSYNKDVLGLQSVSREKSPCADTFGILQSRNHETRDSYKDLRYESHQRHYQKVSDHENKRIKDSESTISQRYSHHYENSGHQSNYSDHRKHGYKYKNDGVDYHSESSDGTRWSARTPNSSERKYDRMSGVRSNDTGTTSCAQHRSVSVTQDQFSDRYDPQSAYCDGDPTTSTFYDGSKAA